MKQSYHRHPGRRSEGTAVGAREWRPKGFTNGTTGADETAASGKTTEGGKGLMLLDAGGGLYIEIIYPSSPTAPMAVELLPTCQGGKGSSLFPLQ